MISTYDFLGSEALSHLNSIKGIIGHLEEKTLAGDEEARRVLESIGYTLQTFKFVPIAVAGTARVEFFCQTRA